MRLRKTRDGRVNRLYLIEIIVGLASSANAWTVLLLNIVFGDRRPFSRQVTLIFGIRIQRFVGLNCDTTIDTTFCEVVLFHFLKNSLYIFTISQEFI